MSTYVVFKSHVFEPENEVYFAYTLADALDLQEAKTAESDFEWELAEVIPTDNWLIKLILWAISRSK